MKMEDKLLPHERWQVEIMRMGARYRKSQGEDHSHDSLVEAFDRIAPCPPDSEVAKQAHARWWETTRKQQREGRMR